MAEKELKLGSETLEIGSGAGISKLFFDRLTVTRTDLLEFPEGGVIGNVNCENLNLETNSQVSVFGMDVLHHIPRPYVALEEMKRVIDWDVNSRIILIEPYVSIFSYLPYKLFHDEKTSFFNIGDISQPLVNEIPEDGNQTVPKWIFETRKGQIEISRIFPRHEFIIEIKYLSWLAFYLTGGLTNPSRISAGTIRAFIGFEQHIPQRIMKYLASRMYISIRSKSI